jgi:hypothetical protein
MRVYSIKQNTKTEKEAAKLFYSLQKQCFYWVIHCAANSIDVQELVTVQQMGNGNFVNRWWYGEQPGADLGFFVPRSKFFGRRGVIGAGRGLEWAW